MATDDELAACRRRLDRLRRHLEQEELGAALLVRPEHLRYLAGHRPGGGPAALVVTRSAAVLVAPSGVAAAEECAALGIDLVPYAAYDAGRLVDRAVRAYAALGEVGRRLALRGRVGVEADNILHAAVRAVDAA